MFLGTRSSRPRESLSSDGVARPQREAIIPQYFVWRRLIGNEVAMYTEGTDGAQVTRGTVEAIGVRSSKMHPSQD